MATFEKLKAKLESVAITNGCIYESDYEEVCHNVTDRSMLNRIAHWLLSSGVPLKKGITPQYQQGLKRRVKHPNVRDVVDTKENTHDNSDKLQESKKDATLNLNDTIKDKKETKTKDEFMPSWDRPSKKNIMFRVEDKSTFNVFASMKLYYFAKSSPEVIAFLASQGIDVHAWEGRYDAPSLQSYLLGIVRGIPSKSYINVSEYPDLAEYANIDFGDYRTAENLITSIDDVRVLDALIRVVGRGEYSNTPQSDTPASPAIAMPSGVREIDLGAAKHRKRAALSSLVYANSSLTFANGKSFTVALADTPAKKAAGLEPFEGLKEDEGMFFPFDNELVTFHMGKVKFPIDIVFLMEKPHGMEILKTIEDIKPGTRGQWSANGVSAVLEVVGGTCKKLGLTVGTTCATKQKD